MTVRDRIIDHLKGHPEGVDDDALAEALGLTHRQHANQECQKLESAGRLERRRADGKILNLLQTRKAVPETTAILSTTQALGDNRELKQNPDKPWDWEVNVQNAVVAFLVSNGFTILRLADTFTKEQGKDIIAVAQSGRQLWVSVKGQPEGTDRTSPYLMARHYFESAVHDLLRWRQSDKSVTMALALPDFVTYRNSAKKVSGQLLQLNACIYWVFESGKIEVSANFT